MEDQLALFIRWRIFFSSFLGVVLDAMNNSSENSWVRTLPACFMGLTASGFVRLIGISPFIHALPTS
jgi:hypothetical protein